MTKEEFDNKLKNIFITRKDFSDLTGVKYTTVTKWNDNDRPVPSWVDSWLNNYIDKKKFDNIKSIIKDEID